MFKKQTVFIVGAGASAEVGLPLGRGLAATIGKKMDIRFEYTRPIGNGDFELYEQITQGRRIKTKEFQQAALLIRNGVDYAQSIDDFLDQHRTNDLVNLYGKAAIAKAVLEAEKNSALTFDPPKHPGSLPVETLSATWFVKFMHMLTRGVPKENAREIFNRVSFIVFNYDRCVEFFLIHALSTSYGIPLNETSAIVADLHIVHPYGQVGDLNRVPFGYDQVNYVELAESIKTYTEQIGEADVIQQIAQEIARADTLVFLGFAYHDQNLTMLKPKDYIPRTRVFGTAFKMSDSDVDVVSDQIGKFLSEIGGFGGKQIKIDNSLTCAGLFDNYAKSLTGGD